MPTLQDFKAQLFKAMANPVRIRMLEVLRENGSLTVGEIQHMLQIEASNASQHLGMLRLHGVVNAAREGTSIRYTIAWPELLTLLDVSRELFEKQVEEQNRVLAADSRPAPARKAD